MGKKKKKNINNVKKKDSRENITEEPPVHNECFPEKSNSAIENQENCVSSKSSKLNENSEKSSLTNESIPSGSAEDSPSKPEISE